MSLDYDRINRLIDELKLTEAGVEYRGHPSPKFVFGAGTTHYTQTEANFIELLELIPILFKRSGSRMGCNSYSLKHTLEDGMECNYVSNSFCILAFAYLDYVITPYKEAPSMNANIHATSLIKDRDTLEKLVKYIQKIKQPARPECLEEAVD